MSFVETVPASIVQFKSPNGFYCSVFPTLPNKHAFTRAIIFTLTDCVHCKSMIAMFVRAQQALKKKNHTLFLYCIDLQNPADVYAKILHHRMGLARFPAPFLISAQNGVLKPISFSDPERVSVENIIESLRQH